MNPSEETAPPSPKSPDVKAAWEEWEDESEPLFPGTESWISQAGNLKRLLWVIALLLIILPPLPMAYRAVKNWRAERLVQKSREAVAVGDSDRGSRLLRQAYAIYPASDSVHRVIEFYKAQDGDRTSLQNLLDRMHSGRSDTDELLGIAEVEVNSPERQEFMQALAKLPKKLTPAQSLRLNLIEAAMMAHDGDISGAASHCLFKASLAGSFYSARLDLQGALYLLSLNDESGTRQAVEILQKVARSHELLSISAWRILVKMALSAPSEGKNIFSPGEIHELIALLPHLQGESLSDELTAADMELRDDPSRKEVVKKLVSKYWKSDRSKMLELAWWLNARTFYSQAIILAGEDRPRGDTAWLLVVLYAQDSLGHWGDVAKMLGYTSGEGLPEAERYLILARTAMMKGDSRTAEEDLSNVDGYLYLENSETLVNLAKFEEHIGAVDHASRTYREMANRDETKIEGLKALIRLQSPIASAESLIPLYQELLQASPRLPEAIQDLTYLKLLAGEDIPRAAAVAQKLLAAEPNSLACISMVALAHLRCGNAQGALGLYAGKSVDWASAPEPWRVIRSAVLREAGDVASAEILAATIDPSKLRPEAQALLEQH